MLTTNFSPAPPIKNFNRLEQANNSAHLFIDFLTQKGFDSEGFFVRTERVTNVIVVVSAQNLLNDEFVKTSLF